MIVDSNCLSPNRKTGPGFLQLPDSFLDLLDGQYLRLLSADNLMLCISPPLGAAVPKPKTDCADVRDRVLGDYLGDHQFYGLVLSPLGDFIVLEAQGTFQKAVLDDLGVKGLLTPAYGLTKL